MLPDAARIVHCTPINTLFFIIWTLATLTCPSSKQNITRLRVDIYVIYRLRGPDEKNCARGLENGPSPKGEGRFQDRGHSFSHPDRRCR